MAAICAAT